MQTSAKFHNNQPVSKWYEGKPVLFVVIYHLPGPYSDFQSDFSDFLFHLVFSSDKTIIVGDAENDSLNTAFNLLLDGFSQ